MSFNKKFFATGGIVASSAECTTDTADIFGDGNGKALYTFDYDGSDESANGYHLTPTGVSFGVGGNINYGLRGGESNSMMANTSIGYNYSDITVSWWVKLEGTGSTRLTFSNGGGLKFAFMRIHYNTTASQYRADLFTRTGTTSGTNSLVGYALIDTSLNGSWVHLGMRMGNTLEDSIRNGIYINGTKSTMSYSVGSATSSAGVDDAAPNRFYIGYYYSSALQEPFSIDIDHLRIFNRALTASEIGQLAAEEACVYTATTTDNDYPTTNVAYYKLDNSAEDSVSTNDGTEYNIEYRFGRYGQAAVFNGTSSYIDIGGNLVNNLTAITLSAWVYTDPNTDYSYVMHVGEVNTAGDAFSISRWNNTASSGYDAYTVYANIGAGNVDGNYVLNENTWYHIAVTWEGTTIKFYVDGNLTTTATTSSLSIQASGNSGYIGRYIDNQSYNWEGKIDQVRIFSTALDSDEVSQLYNEKPETDTSNFKTVLYEGTSTKQYISNVGYNLDVDNNGDGGLVWIKQRTSPTRDHRLYDTVRGVYPIYSSRDLAQASSNAIEYDANGFFFPGAENGVNETSEDYVAWVWKGGGVKQNGTGTNVSNVEYSANQEAGFSIVKYTGGLSAATTSTGASVQHGLGAPPDLIISKALAGTHVWSVRSTALDDMADTLWLHDTRDVITSYRTSYPIASSTNDVMYLNYLNSVNVNGQEVIAYCFRSISGYSKIGTYEGNGTTATTTITTGFEPSWVMIKRTDSANSWVIFDNKRDTTSPLSKILYADTNDYDAEGVTTTSITISSTGFSMSTSQYGGSINTNGGQYLYMAFK